MKFRTFLLAAIVGAVFSITASAQDSLVEYVETSCAPEIENFCSTVNKGDGRLVLCFAAHEDQLSERCEYALYQASHALEQAVAAISYVARSCRDDIVKLCPEMTPGDGRILECLDGKSDEVTQGCKDAIEDTVE